MGGSARCRLPHHLRERPQRGFTYDDKAIVRDNPRIRAPGNVVADLHDVLFRRSPGAGTAYRPVLLLSYAVQWWIHGRQAVAFHAANVLLHAGATVLLAALFVGHRPSRRGGLRGGVALSRSPRSTSRPSRVSSAGGGSRRRLHTPLPPFRAPALPPPASRIPRPGSSRCAYLFRARGADQGERLVGSRAGVSPVRLRRGGTAAATAGARLRPRASSLLRLCRRPSPASSCFAGGFSEAS